MNPESGDSVDRLASCFGSNLPPRVQVPTNHIHSNILTYITTILKPSTLLLCPLDPWGIVFPEGLRVLRGGVGTEQRKQIRG